MSEYDEVNSCAPVSIVFCAYNEAQVIEKKIQNLVEIISVDKNVEVLAFCDGSSDSTWELMEKYASKIKVFRSVERQGKSYGMNFLLEQAKGEVVVFTDANVLLDKGVPAVARSCLSDPGIGCACGALTYINETESPTAKAGSLYWKLEEAIKKYETEIGSTMGADGSIFAIKKRLFRTIPVDIIDDMFTSLSILIDGYRVVRCPQLKATEKMAVSTDDEFKRKIRIACRSFNCHRLLWKSIRKSFSTLNLYKYICHKLIRWFTAPILISAIFLGFVFSMLELGWEITSVILLCAIGLVSISWKLNLHILNIVLEIIVAFVATFAGVIMSLNGKKYSIWEIAKSSR
ncbi:glycosyltransferase [Pseudomonadota bacterium]